MPERASFPECGRLVKHASRRLVTNRILKAKNEEMTYFALKCEGKELHPNRGKMNNSLQYILKIFQLSLPYLLNNRKIKRREVANQNAFMK